MGGTARGPDFLGYHRDCGGPVYMDPVRPAGHYCVRCHRCGGVVVEANIVTVPFPSVRAKTAGRRAKRQRFDYRGWDDV